MTVNLKLDIGEVSLDYRNGEPFRTRVVLTNEDGVYYPVFLDVKEIEKDRSILYDLALNEVYERNFPQRAEKELFATLAEKIAHIEEETLSTDRLGKNKETYINQLVKTSENVMVAQGTLRQVKKASNQFTNDQLFEVINTLSVATFQAVDLLRNVINILK